MNCPKCKEKLIICDGCEEIVSANKAKDGICNDCEPLCGDCDDWQSECKCEIEDEDIDLNPEEENEE